MEITPSLRSVWFDSISEPNESETEVDFEPNGWNCWLLIFSICRKPQAEDSSANSRLKKMALATLRIASAMNPLKLPSSSSSGDEVLKLSVNAVPLKRRVFDMGIIGVLAASMVVCAPLEADATRIEYFATVSEPPCELKFVKSGLGYCDVDPGFGVEVPYNELVNVHYTARFDDGIVFDSTYKRARYLTMRLGMGKVIRGLDQGILGGGGVPPMHIGGKRKLHIPPELAYGPEPAGCFSGDCNIPANATLLYDINLVGIYSGNRKQ